MFFKFFDLIFNWLTPLNILISLKELMAFATTIGFSSFKHSCKISINPFSLTNCGDVAYSFEIHKAAVFLTYASLSFIHQDKVSHKYETISGTFIHPIVLTANPRIKGVSPSFASE